MPRRFRGVNLDTQEFDRKLMMQAPTTTLGRIASLLLATMLLTAGISMLPFGDLLGMEHLFGTVWALTFLALGVRLLYLLVRDVILK